MASVTVEVSNLATRTGTEFKSVRNSIGTLASLTTTAKGNLVAAINEVAGALGSAGASIDDASISTLSVWSSSKTNTEIGAVATDVAGHETRLDAVETLAAGKAAINDAAPGTGTTYSSTKITADISAAVSGLIDGAPATLDTLNELAAALGDSPTAITDILAAQALRVRVDAAQAFTDPQKAQGRTNIGAAAAADLGNVAGWDPVADFEAALL